MELALNEKTLWGKYKDKINDAFAMESMSERYGWTPDYIEYLKEKKESKYMTYVSILAGESEAEKKENE